MPRRPIDSDDDLDFDREDDGLDDGEFDLDADLGPDLNDLDDLDDLGGADPEADDFVYSDLQNHQGSGILLYNGRKYAVGLTWLMTDDEAEKNLIYKRADVLRADFFCTRSFVSQSGFGFLSKGHRMGMPSAAAMAADVLVGEWHAMFAAENGWHYVAVHADTIAPDGDRFFESEEEAYNFFLEQADRYQWPKTYAPEAWNVNGNDGEIPLDKILDDVPSTTLKPANLNGVFSGKRNKHIAFIGLIVFVVLFLFSIFAKQLLPSLVPEQAQIPGPVVEVADMLSAPPLEPVQQEDPLMLALENFALPTPSKVIELCMEGFADLMVSLPGWNLTTMRCRNSMVEAVWAQETGTLESIKAHIDQFPFGVNRTYGARGDFLASRVMSNVSQYNKKVQLADREQVLLAVNNRFGNLGRLEVKDIVPLSEQIQRGQDIRGARRLAGRGDEEEEAGGPLTIQDLPSLAVVLNTEMAPNLIQEYFNIPGLRFNFIEWSVYNRRWIYDMQIYLLPQDAPSRERLGQ